MTITYLPARTAADPRQQLANLTLPSKARMLCFSADLSPRRYVIVTPELVLNFMARYEVAPNTAVIAPKLRRIARK